jgi:hypothetical protein
MNQLFLLTSLFQLVNLTSLASCVYMYMQSRETVPLKRVYLTSMPVLRSNRVMTECSSLLPLFRMHFPGYFAFHFGLLRGIGLPRVD